MILFSKYSLRYMIAALLLKILTGIALKSDTITMANTMSHTLISPCNFLAFSYFHKEPKVFSGGELIFPKYNYTFDCPNNSLIMMPGWVEHGVNEVSIEDSDYYDGYGRYSITSFFGNKHPVVGGSNS